MKIVLAELPFKGGRAERGEGTPNLGILYLVSALRRDVAGLEIHYLEGRHDLESHVAEVGRISPDLYGLSFVSPYDVLAYRTITAVKNKYPSLPIICGGPHPTADPESVFGHTPADICCLGEGEETIVELVKNYMTGGDLSTVAGIAYRDNGQVRRTPLRPVVQNLDDLPHPAWDIIDFSRYIGQPTYKGTPSTSITASRGCPFNCTFCSNPIWKLQKPWVRLRSPQNITEEVEYLYQRGIREIYIESDELNPNLEWCIAVFKALKDLGHSDLYFQCNLRARPIAEELAVALSEANCWLAHV